MKANSSGFRSIARGIMVSFLITGAVISELVIPRVRSSAEAVPSPAPASAAKENLNASLKALKLAEENKTEDPVAIPSSSGLRGEFGNSTRSRITKAWWCSLQREGDRYFKLAADFYARTKWDVVTLTRWKRALSSACRKVAQSR